VSQKKEHVSYAGVAGALVVVLQRPFMLHVCNLLVNQWKLSLRFLGHLLDPLFFFLRV
jgi:hypothetical protein